MSETILAVFVILALAGLAIRERRKAANYDYTKLPDANWQLTEYTGGGNSRNWYAPFDGRDLDSYESNHHEQAMVFRACELVEQRRSGRWEGRSVTVSWTPGLDWDVDNHAEWLQKHGARWGVFVRK